MFFFFFSYKVDNWGCVDFLCCLAEIFFWVLGFPLGFLGDFIGNLQRDLFVFRPLKNIIKLTYVISQVINLVKLTNLD